MLILDTALYGRYLHLSLPKVLILDTALYGRYLHLSLLDDLVHVMVIRDHPLLYPSYLIILISCCILETTYY